MMFAGEASTNLTTLYDMLTRMSRQLETVTNDLLETKKKLNETEEQLKIGNRLYDLILTVSAVSRDLEDRGSCNIYNC